MEKMTNFGNFFIWGLTCCEAAMYNEERKSCRKGNMKGKKIAAALFLLAALFLAAACGAERAAVAVTVVLDRSAASMTVGEELVLTATAEPAETPVVWTSSAPQVASVAEGRVTALSAGTAVIEASAGTASAYCAVTVEDGVLVSDAASLLSAVRAAESGGVIRVAAGEYRLEEGIFVGVSLTIEGEEGAALYSAGLPSGEGLFEVAADGVRLSGLALYGAAGEAGTGVTVRGCREAVLQDLSVEGFSAGVRAEGASVLMKNVSTRDNKEGGVCVSGEAGACYLSADERCTFREVLPVCSPRGAENIALDLPFSYHKASVASSRGEWFVWTQDARMTDGTYIADNEAALRAACAAGGRVCAAGEIALTESVFVGAGTHLFGADGNHISVRGAYPAFVLQGSGTSSLAGLHLEKSGGEGSLVLVEADAVIEGCTFTGVFDVSADDGSISCGVEQEKGTYLLLEGNTFTKLRQAARLHGDGVVTGNEVRATRGIVADQDTNIEFKDNLFAENVIDITIAYVLDAKQNNYSGKTVILSAANGNCTVYDLADDVICEDGATLIPYGKRR